MADGQTSEGCNPESKRVHVPFGTWVLSFVRFAPNDRFGPESASPPVWFRGEFYMPPQAAIKWRRQAPTSPAGTVSQPIGKPFNGQAKGLLWLTWRSYAGPPQYYIPPEGGSPEPVRKASADPGQNPWRPGPKARRRHQPSPAKAGVNLREYWKAPLRSRSRSRSRPRHKLTIS